MHLNSADESYLFLLAGFPRPDRLASSTFVVSSTVSRLLETYAAPAFILDGHFDILSFNHLADRLYGLSAQKGPFAANQLWQLFMNPARRKLYVDFGGAARNFVALFRLNSASQLDSSRYQELTDALLGASPGFAQIWNERRAALRAPITVKMRHHEFGVIEVQSCRFPVEGVEGAMVVFLVPENERTNEVFSRSFAATAR